MGILLNRKAVKEFKLIEYSGEPDIKYMPEDYGEMKKVYDDFRNRGVKLPSYTGFLADKFLNPADILILTKEFFIKFRYKEKYYRLTIKMGNCFDGASIPDFVAVGDLARISPYVLVASLVHDALYSNKYFQQNECDDIFESLLIFKKTPKYLIFEYMLGLRLFGFVRYNKNIPDILNWHLGFSTLEQLS